MSALAATLDRGAWLSEHLPEDVIRVLWEVGSDLPPHDWAARLGVAEVDVVAVLDWAETERIRMARRNA